jgi:hypothetical protein
MTDPGSPNKLWRANFKGEFMLGNRKYCYRLTITDYRSRYLLLRFDRVNSTAPKIMASKFLSLVCQGKFEILAPCFVARRVRGEIRSSVT